MLKSTLLVDKKIDIDKVQPAGDFSETKFKRLSPEKSKDFNTRRHLKFFQECFKCFNAGKGIHRLLGVYLYLITFETGCSGDGRFGGLRRDELVKLTVDDVDDRGPVVLIKVQDTKTGRPKCTYQFCIKYILPVSI
jgi:hypothetical protein